MNNEPLKVYGDGTSVRTFISVHDCVEAFDLMIHDDHTGVYNIGSKNAYSIKRLAELVIEETGSESEIEFVSFEEVYGPNFQEDHIRVPDMGRLSDIMNVDSFRTMNDIIQDMISENCHTS